MAPPPLPALERPLRTYLRAVGFLLPAVFISAFNTNFLFPKVRALWERSDLPGSDAQWVLDAAVGLIQHLYPISSAIILILVVLELRWPRWPAFRGPAVATATVLFNAAVLLGTTALSTTIMVALPTLQTRGGTPTISVGPRDPGKESIAARRAELVGRWYGSVPTKGGGRQQWIMDRRADGTFVASFRVTHPGKESAFEAQEAGSWGVTGNLIVATTHRLEKDGQSAPARSSEGDYWDAYLVESFDGSTLSYVATDSGNRYSTRRVPGDFTIPVGG